MKVQIRIQTTVGVSEKSTSLKGQKSEVNQRGQIPWSDAES